MSDSNTPLDRDNFVETQLKLIQIEYEAEIEKTINNQKNLKLVDLVRQGVCIHKLRCLSTRTGLFRRVLITLAHNQSDKQLPAHKITCGDIVSIHEGAESESLASGVVYSLNSNAVTVAFEKESNLNLDQDFNNYCLIKISNDVTYRRLKKALINLRNYPVGGRASALIDLLFGCRLPGRPNVIGPIEFFNSRLDDSQKEAVTFALRSRDLCIIHGPPGTGKTTSIVEVILQHVKRGLRVLVCAPSNVAVDNLVERLASFKARNMIRLGHPARASSDIQKFTLDAAIARSDENTIVEEIRQEVDSLRSSRDRSKRSQITELLKDLKQRERSIIKRVLSGCEIVLATLVSSSRDGPLKHLINDPDKNFDVLIIDECSQALESACWIPLTYVDKCILAGDHYQLPPTIISETAAKEGLELTLMERLLSRFDHEKVVRMLTVQYRMHQKIMEWSSKSFYSNKLTAHQSVENQSMSEISNLTDCPPLLLIDTAGCDMPELDLEEEESKGNEHEADIAASYVTYLITNGVKPEHIGIITPYNLQVELIRLRLNEKHPGVEIRSVDGFQGREKEVIILSLVRSNENKSTGFLCEYRRINVAVTRAKKHLVVICDSDTVTAEKHISSLVDYLNDNGDVRSAHEYLNSMETFKDIERPQHLRFKEMKKETIKKQSKVTQQEKGKKSNQSTKKEQQSTTKTSTSRTQEENENIEKTIRDKLLDFKSSSKLEYSFPPSLTSFERRVVHYIADELNLSHESQGEGDNRHIIVKKIVPKSSPIKVPKEASSPQKEEIKQSTEEPETISLKEETSSTINKEQLKKKAKKSKVKKSNQPEEIVSTVSTKPFTSVQKKPPATILTKNFDLNSKLDKLDDFDEMLELVKQMDSVCFFIKCKVKTATLGQNCQFCKKRFCLAHSMPEIHGCGDAVRAYARSTVRKEGKIYPGLGIPSKKPDPVKRSQLERKMNKKMEEMSSKRKTQPKKD
ncbi:DNA-binding protein SMUBP-2-like [Panonychus citri]|uniref:DNA-binding protein SMUBP-2-like n=1 Tax=Panonychus citri TaxID=50023 RepID=UPI00230803EA|nr:DNA-binding protein SMUBP-2-like [Panonychus citri]